MSNCGQTIYVGCMWGPKRSWHFRGTAEKIKREKKEKREKKREKNPKILLFQDLPPTPSDNIVDFYAITFQLTGAAFHENTRLHLLGPSTPTLRFYPVLGPLLLISSLNNKK